MEAKREAKECQMELICVGCEKKEKKKEIEPSIDGQYPLFLLYEKQGASFSAQAAF